ncbi:tyrosine-type recombinase/integrase [Pseudonocardia hispaniensis]|uniref:Tyrosine-type recombinase/integrase n=1 Tax=Pseudonocardia hispaniensis TaxID=904933 RepID=A0ABW1IYY3_9PSEU
MSGRPPLPVGAHGNITTRQLAAKLWEASCRYRDADGETRKVKRRGASRSGAENALRAALAERRHAAEAHLTPDSRVRDAAEAWLEQRETQLEAGELAPSTLTVYRSAWTLYIEPALGGLRLREVTVARCEVWKLELRKRKGAAATKSARTVLSGILGYAARMGAIPTNPVRDISPIPGGRRKPPRALTRDERARWLAAMEADEKAARWAIPDLTRFMLATGCRISEALAVSWDEVDLEAGTVAVRWHLVPVRGVGLQRVAGAKSEAGTRVLRVPRWCVDMLLARRVAEDSGYPVFPDDLGGWRWPGNVLRVLRQARDEAGFSWVTSHVFRKTCVTVLDEAGLSARAIADVAGHADPSMTQRVYMGRGIASEEAATALEDLL